MVDPNIKIDLVALQPFLPPLPHFVAASKSKVVQKPRRDKVGERVGVRGSSHDGLRPRNSGSISMHLAIAIATDSTSARTSSLCGLRRSSSQSVLLRFTRDKLNCITPGFHFNTPARFPCEGGRNILYCLSLASRGYHPEDILLAGQEDGGRRMG